jgi:hypothetical protein
MALLYKNHRAALFTTVSGCIKPCRTCTACLSYSIDARVQSAPWAVQELDLGKDVKATQTESVPAYRVIGATKNQEALSDAGSSDSEHHGACNEEGHSSESSSDAQVGANPPPVALRHRSLRHITGCCPVLGSGQCTPIVAHYCAALLQLLHRHIKTAPA